MLPHGTQLVQVTGAERPEPLSRVASRHGVPYGKDPMKEAEAAARLALGNVGYEVAAFENTDREGLSRPLDRQGRVGQDRYTRRIHGAVRKRAREVESALEGGRPGLRAGRDREVRRLLAAVFQVSARPQDIPVSRARSGDTRVEIERQRRDGIEFSRLRSGATTSSSASTPERRRPLPSCLWTALSWTCTRREPTTPPRRQSGLSSAGGPSSSPPT